MRESARLEEEAIKMEAKLRMLRETMAKEKEQWGAAKKEAGGSRWRSGRADRGSIRNYDKDVKARHAGAARRRAVDPPRPPGGGSPGGSTRGSPGRPGSSGMRRQLTWAAAKTWSGDDVVRWLRVLGLEAYEGAFRDNEINGEVLLEMGTEDLDYLKITILGHRKMLLKGIEQLAAAVRGEGEGAGEGGGGAATASSSRAATAASFEADPTSAAAGEARPPREDAKVKIVHWSEAKPLSETEVTGGEAPVNLADGEFNEAAAHASFLEAVKEWRTGDAGGGGGGGGGGRVKIEKEGEMWHNPFGGASAAGSGGGGSSLKISETLADPVPPREGGGKLLEGGIDEDAEHRDFQRAVAAWRGDGAVGRVAIVHADSEGESKGAGGAVNGAGAGAAGAGAKGKAESLRGAEKQSCFQCYKLYYTDVDGKRVGASVGDKSFCSDGCASRYNSAKEAAAARARAAHEAAEKEAATKREVSGSDDSGAAAGSPGRELRDADGNVVVAGDEMSPSRDYSNIWAVDVEY